MNKRKRDIRRNSYWLVLVLIILLGLGMACSEDDTKDMASHDAASSDSHTEPADIADDVKADLSREPEDAVDALANDTSDASSDGSDSVEIVEIEEEDDGCHTNCVGGLKCEDGAILTAAGFPIPCWVDPDADCWKHGHSSPCLSEECGDNICLDDELVLEEMLDAAGELHAGEVKYEWEDAEQPRIVLTDEVGVNAIELVYGWLSPFVSPRYIEGTTNWLWLDISNLNYSLMVDGEAVDASEIALSLLIYSQGQSDENGWSPYGPEYVGGIEANLTDGRVLKVAWRGVNLPGCLDEWCKNQPYEVEYSLSLE